MRIYDYLFFKINQLLTLFDYETHFASIIIMCWLFFFNSATLFYFLSFVIDTDSMEKIYFTISGGVVIFGGHLLYFLRKDRIERIIKRFKNEKRVSSILGLIGTVLYIALSIWLFSSVTVPNTGGTLK